MLGLRAQIEAVQASGMSTDWVTHSRGGVKYVLAASGSKVEKLDNNAVVFHAGANTQRTTDVLTH